MRKEAEEAESPTRSIRDSGYIDCWDSERSDSLSPPHHGREDSFDSLDSFGSRSQQTPSPDVLVPRGNSDGRGSDSESDGPLHRKIPDVRKDDMSARRTSVSEVRTVIPFNQYLPNKSNQSGYLPTPLRNKKNDKDEGGRKSWSTATSPVGGVRPLSTPARLCSEEHHPSALASNPTASLLVTTGLIITQSERRPPVTEEEQEKEATDAEQDGTRGGRTLTSPRLVTTPSPTHFLPVPIAVETTATTDASGRRKGRAKSESDDQHRRTSWSDGNPQATSVSMIDMRGEEEAILQPHSQVRHELMHNQYNQMREEEDHWQDDLARWKSRRRSISQDLIKKEEERKMMEQLMTGDSCPSSRRRSIKTYREIVEEKERREDELREAYKKATTQQEASAILQRYAQRFSISETVLERLQLPKLLDRSISADPSFPCPPFPLSLSGSPTTPDPFDVDPNGPLRYLRQQSAPAPKFTSTLEARIEEVPKDPIHHRPQIRSRSSEPPVTRGLSTKSVPMLTPKPYLQSQNTAADPCTTKVDGFLRVNGDAPATPENRGRELLPHFKAFPSINSPVDATSSTFLPTPSPKASPERESPVSAKSKETQACSEPASKEVQEEKLNKQWTSPCRPTSLPSELQKPVDSFGKTRSLLETAPGQQTLPTEAKHEQQPKKTELISNHVQPEIPTQQSQPVPLQARVPSSHEPPEERKKLPSLAAPGTFGYHPPKEMTAEFANSTRSPLASSNPKLRWDFFAQPEGTEKECRTNEKYQREQEKLKEEWEKAQTEVAEEERKYHEEERRILEETVAPLTPRSSALPSPSRGKLSSASEPQETIVRSLADWERKQELLEWQMKGSTDSAEWKLPKNDRTSDISTGDDSMKTSRSSPSQSSNHAETLGHSQQNGQKLPPMPTKPLSPVKKQEEAKAESDKSSRPAGDRRICPMDNNMVRTTSSKPPEACPPPADTQPLAPNRSVSGKKLCSSCGQPLGKGAAMIIETLSLYFHIQCFKCGVCKGQLGDTTTGTDVRIRNGLLNCHQCYIRSRSAGQPTTL